MEKDSRFFDTVFIYGDALTAHESDENNVFITYGKKEAFTGLSEFFTLADKYERLITLNVPMDYDEQEGKNP
jgi:hypothetical protein